MHKECGGYCYLTYKPVLDHIMQLTDEIERKKEELEHVEELLSRSKEVVLLGIDALKSYNVSNRKYLFKRTLTASLIFSRYLLKRILLLHFRAGYLNT